nr:hypothetical protein [Treponema phagedenis]
MSDSKGLALPVTNILNCTKWKLTTLRHGAVVVKPFQKIAKCFANIATE